MKFEDGINGQTNIEGMLKREGKNTRKTKDTNEREDNIMQNRYSKQEIVKFRMRRKESFGVSNKGQNYYYTPSTLICSPVSRAQKAQRKGVEKTAQILRKISTYISHQNTLEEKITHT